MQSASEPQNIPKDASACPLQNSDSGADLSEHFADRLYPCIAEEPSAPEPGRSELATKWERHWAVHGEAIIWKSWIERYGIYINPTYTETCVVQEEKKPEPREIPDVKITYSDDGEEEKIGRADSFGSGSAYEPRHGLRSRCSNGSVSGKSVANTTITTDSMTNVTKITVSSLDLSCECDSERSGSSISSSTDPSSG